MHRYSTWAVVSWGRLGRSRMVEDLSVSLVARHRLVATLERRGEVRRRLSDVRMSQPVSDGLQGHPTLDPTRPRFTTEIVEMEIDGPEVRSRCGGKLAPAPHGRKPVSLENDGIPRLPEVL